MDGKVDTSHVVERCVLFMQVANFLNRQFILDIIVTSKKKAFNCH